MEDPYSPTPMTPDIQKLILEFAGQTYGEAKQLGDNIVQQSISLQNTSEGMKQSVSKVLKDVTQRVAQQFPVAPQFVPTPVPQPVVPQSVPSMQVQLPINVQPIDQLEFNFATIKAEDVYNELRSLRKDIKDLYNIIESLKNDLVSKKKKIL